VACLVIDADGARFVNDAWSAIEHLS